MFFDRLHEDSMLRDKTHRHISTLFLKIIHSSTIVNEFTERCM